MGGGLLVMGAARCRTVACQAGSEPRKEKATAHRAAQHADTLVGLCAEEYKDLAERQSRQLSGLQAVLGSLRRRTPSGRAADDCDASAALADALVEAVWRAAAKDFAARDAAIRKYLLWMQQQSTAVLATSGVCTVDSEEQPESVAAAPSHDFSAAHLMRPSFQLGKELLREYFERQLRVTREDCERQCTEAQEQLSRARADAALAQAEKDAVDALKARLEAEHREQVKSLSTTIADLQRETKRQRFHLHVAKRQTLELRYALDHSQPLATSLVEATAAAARAGLYPQELIPPPAPAALGGDADPTPAPATEPGRTASAPQARSQHLRRCSAPNILEPPMPTGRHDRRQPTSPSRRPQPPQHRAPSASSSPARRGWAPTRGPRSKEVVAVVGALSSVQRMLNNAASSTQPLELEQSPLEARAIATLASVPDDEPEEDEPLPEPKPPPRKVPKTPPRRAKALRKRHHARPQRVH